MYVASAKVTRQEQMELEQTARAEGKALSEWAREVLLREARRSDHDAVFTEIVATRMLLVNLIKPLILGKPVTSQWITEAMSAVRRPGSIRMLPCTAGCTMSSSTAEAYWRFSLCA
jgi:hypothetical protein